MPGPRILISVQLITVWGKPMHLAKWAGWFWVVPSLVLSWCFIPPCPCQDWVWKLTWDAGPMTIMAMAVWYRSLLMCIKCSLPFECDALSVWYTLWWYDWINDCVVIIAGAKHLHHESSIQRGSRHRRKLYSNRLSYVIHCDAVLLLHGSRGDAGMADNTHYAEVLLSFAS